MSLAQLLLTIHLVGLALVQSYLRIVKFLTR